MIILTGGKTGGHIMPLIALAKVFDNVLYIGAKNSLEEKICAKYEVEFYGLPLINKKIKIIIKAYKQVKLPKESIIISTGGYVSLPVLIYAVIHKIKIYLLEENLIMGTTNKIISLFAKKIFLTYELPTMNPKYKLVGLPLIHHKLNYIKYANLNFDILIIGGSLGSKPLCELVYSLNEKYKICLIAGRYFKDYQNIKNVITLEFVDDLPNLMLQAKLIICRAGAGTTYETFYVNKPCIIIPSLKTKKNHQIINANYFKNKGCCININEKEAKKEILKAVKMLLSNEQMQANQKINQKEIITNNSIEIIKREINDDI